MVADAVTFAAAFAGIAAGIGLYLWRLERRAKALERRLATLEHAVGGPGTGGGPGEGKGSGGGRA